MATLGKYEVLCPLPQQTEGTKAFLGALKGFGGFRKLLVLREVLSELSSNEAVHQAFLAEVTTVSAFHHPHIAGVFDLEAAEGRLILATEFSVGVSLDEIASAFRAAHVRIPLGLMATALRDVALALHYAHTYLDPTGAPASVSHGALSAECLQVTFDGVTQVLDFGAPKPRAVERTPAADLAALGALVPVVLADQPQDVALTTRSDMTAEMRAVLARLSGVRQPYASALEFAHALEQVAGSILWRAEHSAALMQSTFNERLREWQDLIKKSEDLGGHSTSQMPLAKVFGAAPATLPAAPAPKPGLAAVFDEPLPEPAPISNEPTDVKLKAIPVIAPTAPASAVEEVDTGVRMKPSRPNPRPKSGGGLRVVLLLLLALAIPGMVVVKWKKDPDWIRTRSPQLAEQLGRLATLFPAAGFPPARAPAPVEEAPPLPEPALADSGVAVVDAGPSAGVADAGPPPAPEPPAKPPPAGKKKRGR